MTTINLSGPQGNAIALIGIAKDLCRQLGQRDRERDIQAEMMSGDYNNLLDVFEKNFGEYVELINKPEGYVGAQTELEGEALDNERRRFGFNPDKPYWDGGRQ
jgi:hypothetical protein